MRMKKFFALFLSFLLLVSLTACGSAGEPSAKQPEQAEPSAPAAQPADGVTYPLTLTDMAGREVTVEREPQRIVSGYYISSSACIALGLRERLVGVEDKAGQRPIYSLAAPELMELPNVGSAKAFDLEACVAAEPDLVILPMKQKDTAAALEELGIPALLVLPESHQQVLEMFDLSAPDFSAVCACSTVFAVAPMIKSLCAFFRISATGKSSIPT